MADIEKLRQLHKEHKTLQAQKLAEVIAKLEELMERCAPYHLQVVVIFPKPGHAYGESSKPGVPSNVMYSVSQKDTSLREYITNGIKEKYESEGFKVELDIDEDIYISWEY